MSPALFAEAYRAEGLPPWEERLDRLVAKVREKAEPFSAKETEREITAASVEARSAKKKHASRRR
ncbi:MAG: hypothetical protein ACRD1Z_07710 [Vicinamibacteria bacterium]